MGSIFSDGTYYEGEFVDGQFSGDGIMGFPDGSNYEGEFENGEFHGLGYTQIVMEKPLRELDRGEYKEEDNNNISEEEVSLIGTLESVTAILKMVSDWHFS